MENLFLYVSIGIGIIISLLNFYLSFLAQKIEKLERVPSGIPLIGSLILFISLFYIENKVLFWMVLIIALIDTAGIHWAILIIIHEKIMRKLKKTGNK